MGEPLSGLTNIERLVLAKVSDNHIAFIARRAGQVYALKVLEDLDYVYKVADPLFGHTWHITDKGRAALGEGEAE